VGLTFESLVKSVKETRVKRDTGKGRQVQNRLCAAGALWCEE
jgi:hypothetical protein